MRALVIATILISFFIFMGCGPSVFPIPISTALPAETLILIAPFSHNEFADTEPHAKIYGEIKRVIEELDIASVRVEIIDTGSDRLKAEDWKIAEELGRSYNATMIIWGEDTGVSFAVNFLNLRDPDSPLSRMNISEYERVRLSKPEAYVSFVTRDLPFQLTFFSLFAIGNSFYLEEDYDNALKLIIAALNSSRLVTKDVEGVAHAYFRLGWLYQVSGDLTKAIDAYSTAVSIDPFYSKAYNNRGIGYITGGRYYLAIRDFDEAIKSLNHMSHMNLGAETNMDSKKAILEEAAYYNNRAIALEELGRIAEAESDCHHFLQLLVSLGESDAHLSHYPCRETIVLDLDVPPEPEPTPTISPAWFLGSFDNERSKFDLCSEQIRSRRFPAYESPNIVEVYEGWDDGRGCILRLRIFTDSWGAYWFRLGLVDLSQFDRLIFDMYGNDVSPGTVVRVRLQSSIGEEFSVQDIYSLSDYWQTYDIRLSEFHAGSFGVPLRTLTDIDGLAFEIYSTDGTLIDADIFLDNIYFR